MKRADRFLPEATIHLLLAGALLVAGCGGSETASAERPSPDERTEATAESCIAAYAERPCELLTEDLLRRHVSAPAEVERTDVAARMAELGLSPRRSSRAAQNGCSYSWNGGRTMSPKVSLGQGTGTEGSQAIASALQRITQNVPVDDTVAFKSIQVLENDDALARFERKWRAPTAEERERLARRMDEAMEEARKEGKLTDAGAGTGARLGRSFANAAISYEPVDGIGRAARWGGLGSERSLMVLDGDTEFAVVVDVSDEEAKNRELAMAIARGLLDRCGD